MKETIGCIVAGVLVAFAWVFGVFVTSATASFGWHVGGMWWM